MAIAAATIAESRWGDQGDRSYWEQTMNTTFRMKTKALLFVTDRRQVVYLPTTEGFSVLMSVSEPDRFMHALHEVVGK